MTMFATFEDFSDRIPGGIAQEDAARARAMLEDASALIQAETGTDWSGVGETVPDVVRTITMSAAKRAFLNPDGVTALAVDGHSAQFATGSPDVYLTSAEKRAVRAAAGRSAVWSLATTRTEDPSVTTGELDTPSVQDGDDVLNAGPLSDFFA